MDNPYIGGWGCSTGKSFRFVRACERARRGEAPCPMVVRISCGKLGP